MIKLLKSIFSSKPAKVEGQDDIFNFVNFVVCSLVDNPNKVEINSSQSPKGIHIKITCEKEDIGKIIGKKGKTLLAIRSLVNGAAGRIGKRAFVDLAE